MHRVAILGLALVAIIITSCEPRELIADKPKPRVSLNVAIFAYVPDASAAIEQLEDKFEAMYDIDVDFELWNPYDEETAYDGTAQMPKFDVVEIDLCRFTDLKARLEPLPIELLGKAEEYVEPAKTVMHDDLARYAMPHWVCCNFLMYRTTNAERGPKSRGDAAPHGVS